MDRERNEGWVGDVREYVKDIIKKGHDVQEISLGFRHKHDDVMESQRMVEDDHEVVVETLEKLTNGVLLVPVCFSPLVVMRTGDLLQRGDPHSFVLLQLANKEGSMGEELEIFEGRAIPCPGEGVRGRVTVAQRVRIPYNIVGATGNSQRV